MSIPTCAVRTVVLDSVGGQPLAGAIVSARLSSYEIYQGFVVPQDIEVTSAADGSVMLPLFPNELGSASSFYEVKIIAPNGKTLRTVAVVPNEETAELSEISEVPPYEGKPDAAVTISQVQALKVQTQSLHDQTAVAAGQAHSDALATGAYALQTAGDRTQTGLDRIATGGDRDAAATSASDAAEEREGAEAAALDAADSLAAALAAGRVFDGANAAATSSSPIIAVGDTAWLRPNAADGTAGGRITAYKRTGAGTTIAAFTKDQNFASGDEFDAVIDVRAERFFHGKKVVHARSDPSSDAVGDVITSDTKHYANYAIRPGDGLTWVLQSDGLWLISMSGVLSSIALSAGYTWTAGSAPYYFQGKQVYRASTDLAGRPSIVEFVDAIVDIPRFNYRIRGLNGIAVTKVSDGWIELSTGNFTSLQFTSGHVIDSSMQYYHRGRLVRTGETDSALRVSWASYADGGFYIAKLDSPALDAAGISPVLDAPGYIFDIAVVGGTQQLFRTNKTTGVRTQATTLGNNRMPVMSADASKVIYTSDRNGSRQGFYQLLDGSKYGGGVEHPVIPFNILCHFGDSLIAGDVGSAVAALFGIPVSGPASDPRAGIGSQNSTQIAARFGAIPVTCSLAGNTMTAGANVLTAIGNHLLSRVGDTAGAVRSLKAVLLGVTGTLTSTQGVIGTAGTLPFGGQGYAYTFTPDAGQALPGIVPAGSTFVIDPELRQDCVVMLSMIRNDVGQPGWQATNKANIAAVMAAIKSLVRRVILIGGTNSTSEPAGSTNYNEIVAHNADLAALYPGSVVDVRPAYNAGTSDDTPNPAYTADGLHYNNAGKAIWAGSIFNTVNPKGWFAS